MAAPIGLDIGSSAIRATQLRQGRNGTSLERLGQISLPVGAVRDGEIVEADVVVEALKDLWKSAKLKRRKVSVGLANQQVVVRRLDLPYMTESELRASLPLQVDGLIPIPVHEAVLDFCYLGEHTGDDGERMVRILVVAALRTMVDELLSVVRRAKLDPVGIDLDAFAALRSLTPPEVLADPAAELLVDVGATVTGMVVHQNGSPHFVRTVLFGGQRMTTLLSEQLGVDLDEAERLKLELARAGLVAGTSPNDATATSADERRRPAAEAAGSLSTGADEGWRPAAEAAGSLSTGADEGWRPAAEAAGSLSTGADEGPSVATRGWSSADQFSQPAANRHGWSDNDETAQIGTHGDHALAADGHARADDALAADGHARADDDAAEIVRDQTRRLIDEIKGSLDYCATQQDIPSIQRVVLTGGASQWPGLAEALANELGLDITTGSPLQMVGNGSALEDDELAATAPHLAVAVGLALGAQQ